MKAPQHKEPGLIGRAPYAAAIRAASAVELGKIYPEA